MIRTNTLLITVSALIACIAGCASAGDGGFAPHSAGLPPTPATNATGGHLVIVGGGLKKDNADIHYRFVALCAEGPIGIIPIASGDGLAAGTESALGWRGFSGEKRIVVIPLTKDSHNVNDREVADQIASCGGLWFTGGDQSRVTAILKPNGEATESLKACFAVLAKGGVIGGTSAGAAIMTDPMITGGQSPGRRTRASDESDSPPSSVRIGPGLGFLPVGLTDQHFLERGRMGRLITALHEQHIPIGFGIRENCALVVDLKSSTGEALGNRAVCVLSPIDSSEGDSASRMASLSVLSTGDRVFFGRGETDAPHNPGGDAFHRTPLDPRSITPAAGLSRPSMAPRPASSGASATRRVPDPWDMGVIENALDRMAADPAQIILQSDRVRVDLFSPPASRMLVDPTAGRPPCLINLWIGVRSGPQLAPGTAEPQAR